MTLGGWINMVLSVGAVTVFFAGCLWLVLARPQSTEHIHGPADIDTHETDEP